MCEFPHLGSQKLQNSRETEMCDFPHFGPNTTQKETKRGPSESCDFPTFGPSTQNEKKRPKVAISPLSVHPLRTKKRPKVAISPLSVHPLYFRKKIKETERCDFPSFGPNTLHSSKETEKCEFPTFGPNLKDGRQRKPHFSHFGPSESNNERECVQACTEIHQSGKLNEQTNIEETNIKEHPIYLNAVDTSNQKYVPTFNEFVVKTKKTNVSQAQFPKMIQIEIGYWSRKPWSKKIRHLIFAIGTITFKGEPEELRIELIEGEETPGLCSDNSMAAEADSAF